MDEKKFKKLLEDSFRKLFVESFNKIVMPALTKVEKRVNVRTDILEFRTNSLEEKLDSHRDEVVSFKNGVYDRLDAIYKEVVSVRVEQAAHAGAHDRIDETLEDHNKRIKKLESPPVTTHSVK